MPPKFSTSRLNRIIAEADRAGAAVQQASKAVREACLDRQKRQVFLDRLLDDDPRRPTLAKELEDLNAHIRDLEADNEYARGVAAVALPLRTRAVQFLQENPELIPPGSLTVLKRAMK